MSEVQESKEDKYERLIFKKLINKIKKKLLSEIENNTEHLGCCWKSSIYINNTLIREISSSDLGRTTLSCLIEAISRDRLKELITDNVEYTEIKIDITQLGKIYKIEF